ncbi:hypothetical protein K9U40_03930 [Xanthobacter autotrophicus]|uniref:hypothetical protein n=1 Tax=Xanthobacter TaxID=279 RepID=UPI0024ABA8C7|nr:hypothetical protein [Xanthobacter autotrophicus]MDI4663488.1 hypothetical protein [Xanthobacter autotrophicus]
MREDQRKTLRGAVAALEALRAEFARSPRNEITAGDFRLLSEHVARIEQASPGALPLFDPDYFRGRVPPQFNLYEAGRVRRWLDVALATLSAALEPRDERSVPREVLALDFSFLSDAALRRILERDSAELARSFSAGNWKSVVVLSGGIMEAMLIDATGRAMAQAAEAGGKPQKPKNLYGWIEAAFELKLVSEGVKKISHTLREYRNLVHAQAELKAGLSVDEEEARLAAAILAIVKRDLSALPR